MRTKCEKLENITVLPLAVKYPQGAEKQLIKAAINLEVPSGGLPMDVGCLVHNVGTAVSIYEAVSSKKPLIDRIVTVTGPGIKSPNNLRVRIGTPFQNLIDFCGGLTETSAKIINGGPMMGISQVTPEVPVIKGTSGILVLDKKQGNLKPEQPCISCARCVDICPMDSLTIDMNEKAVRNPARCIGRGLCVSACAEESITLERVAEEQVVVPPESYTKLMTDIAHEKGRTYFYK